MDGGWAFRSADFVPATAGSPPPGVTFPHGLFDFVLEGGTAGSAAEVTITYPAPLPAGTVYWKYGPTPPGYGCSGTVDCAQPHWYVFPGAVVQGNTVRLTIVDGGVGDDDRAADGAIIDAGGPGFAGPAGAASIPTLSEAALAALAGLLLLLACMRLRAGGRQSAS